MHSALKVRNLDIIYSSAWGIISIYRASLPWMHAAVFLSPASNQAQILSSNPEATMIYKPNSEMIQTLNLTIEPHVANHSFRQKTLLTFIGLSLMLLYARTHGGFKDSSKSLSFSLYLSFRWHFRRVQDARLTRMTVAMGWWWWWLK